MRGMYIRVTTLLQRDFSNKTAPLRGLEGPFGRVIYSPHSPVISERLTLVILMQSIKGIRLMLAGIFLLFLMVPAVNGYTIVYKDGRRVTVPDNFEVGASTLTYEVSSGIQITIQLNAIDVSATEKVNNETKGALLGRLSSKASPIVSPQRPSPRSVNTVTNVDLEGFRQTRVTSEQLYEKKRQELGLPSLEESRKASLETATRAQIYASQVREDEQRLESYWRSRASELRANLADVNARIGVVQSRLNELPLNYSFGTFTTFPALSPFAPFGGGRPFRPPVFANASSIGLRPAVVGATTVAVGVPAVRPLRPIRRNGFGGGPFSNRFGVGTVIALPFDSYDNSYERSQLISELNQLVMQRAGLQARWRELEDEARRSGAYPGWLR